MSELPARRGPQRRFLLALIAGAGLALLPALAHAQPDAAAAREVNARLTALLANLPAEAQVGVVVDDVADGRRWFACEPQTPLKPASVMKLFVTAATLERFGPDSHYRTKVYTHAGELWVVGAGDPSLGDERLARRDGHTRLHPFDRWADALKARGIDALEKIVLDDSVFDRQWRHPDWPDDQSTTWYQAPVGGLNFNDNCLAARLELRDGVVQLSLHPDLPPGFYDSSLRLGKRHQPLIRRSADRDVFEFVGTANKSAQLGPISVRRPTVFFGYALRQALETQGIAIRGEVVRRTITPQARAAAPLLAEHITPRAAVLWRCNTFSQNLFAECLLKSLAAYGPDGSRSGQTGSWEAGTAVLRATLAEMGVDMTGAVLRDGSGLSHLNRVTAEQVTSLLVRMHRHRHQAVFSDSLAVPGRAGSLRRRYADPVLGERLRGKTGTLSGVRSLAGYVTRPEGSTLAFAILCNGPCDPQLPLRVARVLAGPADSR